MQTVVRFSKCKQSYGTKKSLHKQTGKALPFWEASSSVLCSDSICSKTAPIALNALRIEPKYLYDLFFHIQDFSFKNIDLASFSCHKFYGIKGVGCLYKKENIVIEPLIHGGKSTTIYRSGTPATALIASFAKALRLIYENLDEYVKEITKKNIYLKEKLSKYDGVFINSNEYSIPHILNLSIIGVKPETMLHALEEHDIYISTQSACSTGASSKAVMAVTNSEERANSSIRISLSHLTTKEELDTFMEAFDECYKHLKVR